MRVLKLLPAAVVAAAFALSAALVFWPESNTVAIELWYAAGLGPLVQNTPYDTPY